MNDILKSIIYQLDNDTSLPLDYLSEILYGLELEEIPQYQAGLLAKGYIKALHDLKVILPEVWEKMTDKISDFLASELSKQSYH